MIHDILLSLLSPNLDLNSLPIAEFLVSISLNILLFWPSSFLNDASILMF